MFNSAAHEIFSANKYLTFLCLFVENFSRSSIFSKNDFAVVSSLRFISRTIFSCSAKFSLKNVLWSRGLGWLIISWNLDCEWDLILSLRKHSYSNILKKIQPKIKNFQTKNYDIFHISAQNIDCGYSLEPPRRGGSNEYSQSMFLSRMKKNNVYPCKPQFYYIKVGFKGVKII